MAGEGYETRGEGESPVTGGAYGFAENKLWYEIVICTTVVSSCESTVQVLTPFEFHLCDSQHVVFYESVGH